jgi:hypothetical protein
MKNNPFGTLFTKLTTPVFLCLLLASLTPQMAHAASPHVYGKTIGDWGHAWWEWVLNLPADNNPLSASGDTDCISGQQGKV